LQDLVSYDHKHNEANGEDNRDGANDNASWNCGAEGPTDNPEIIALRHRQKRNLIATLLLSQGVPMLLGGDELSHTQNGNNNTYCQDNELSWLHWDLDEPKQEFLKFVRKVAEIWRSNPVFQRRRFFQGRAIRGGEHKDLSWFAPDGDEMSDEAWNAGFVKCLGMRLAGDAIPDTDERGQPLVGDTLLLLLNAHYEPIPFKLPATADRAHWVRVIDTAEPGENAEPLSGGAEYGLAGRSLVVLRLEREAEPAAAEGEIDLPRKESEPQAASTTTSSLS
jgi:glycogen operon protein